MKKTTQKFAHYTFLTVLYCFGTSVAGLIVYSLVIAFNQIN